MSPTTRRALLLVLAMLAPGIVARAAVAVAVASPVPAAAPVPATTPAVAAPVAPLPSLDTIVAAHVAARGGLEKLHALRSMRATGLAIFPGGKQAPVVREIARPGRIRLEITYQGLQGVYAHDGTQGWQVAPLQGHFAPEPLPEEVARPSVDQLDIEGPLVDWQAKGHVVTLVGRARVGERDAYELEEHLAGGALRRDFLDAQTALILRTDVERVVGGRKVLLEATFGDYRPVDGIMFPFRIETGRVDRPQRLRFVVQKIEINPVIDEARFRMPMTATVPAVPAATPTPARPGPG